MEFPKKESDFINLIPKLFNKQKEGFLLYMMDQDQTGDFFIKQKREYLSFMDLERATWSINYSDRYLAFIKNKDLSIITFSGKEKTISYRINKGKVEMSFFKDKLKGPGLTLISEGEKSGIFSEISDFFRKKAS